MRALAIACLLSLAAPAAAQQSRIDADKLPLNVTRVKQQLARTADREEREGLNLRYYVNIYGEGPRLLIFREDDNLATGPVPYGAPTHQEFMQFWTPQEFSSPPADLTTVMRWLAERLNGKKQR
jgi:hypothetical protein